METQIGQRRAGPGDWVVVHRVVLPAGKRAPGVPPETRAVPLEMWVKGFLDGDVPIGVGEPATVRTLAGRLVSAILVAINPPIPHTFGRPVPELLKAGQQLRARLRGTPAGGDRQ